MTNVVDPSTRVLFMPDGRRLTAQRTAGFALEQAFKIARSGGLWSLNAAPIATVEVTRVALGRPESPKRPCLCCVTEIHQEAIAKATQDICGRLHAAGYAIVACIVPQRGAQAHDLVLEFRGSDGGICRGQYSGELKLRTAPANREAMRKDCHGIFIAACRESMKWLGQIIIAAEISAEGNFLRSRAEILLRDRPRTQPLNLWGWGGGQ